MTNVNRTSRWTPEDYRQRPREYDPILFDVILERVSNGDMLVDICRDRDMPLPATFIRWTRQSDALGARYREALEIGADVLFDEVVTAAHDQDIYRGRLRSDALRFRTERAMPDKYGPRAALKLGGGADEASGIDYAAEVRSRLRSMAERLAAPAGDPGKSG